MRPDSEFSGMTSFSIFFFDINFVSLVSFSYRSEFNVKIITASGATAISFYKRLTRNREIENTRLSFAQYLETETRQEYQIWHERL